MHKRSAHAVVSCRMSVHVAMHGAAWQSKSVERFSPGTCRTATPLWGSGTLLAHPPASQELSSTVAATEQLGSRTVRCAATGSYPPPPGNKDLQSRLLQPQQAFDPPPGAQGGAEQGRGCCRVWQRLLPQRGRCCRTADLLGLSAGAAEAQAPAGNAGGHAVCARRCLDSPRTAQLSHSLGPGGGGGRLRERCACLLACQC